MNNVVHIGTPREKKRKRGRPAGVAMNVGLLLALTVYCLLIEQYGFPFLEMDGDEHVDVEATP